MKLLTSPASWVALAWSFFQIYMVYGDPLHLIVAVPIHVMFGVALTFILQPLVSAERPGARAGRGLDYLLVLAAAAIAVYFLLSGERLTTRIAAVDPLLTADYVVGIATLLLVIEATRRALGAGLTIVILVFLVYQFSGTLLRGVPVLDTISHRGEPSWLFFESFLDLQILQNQGVFGIPSVVSYTQVFYFLLFGAFLELFGGGRLFIDLSMLLVGRFRGGMAKVSILSSTLFGAVSGSATANASVMGMFTIPAMKKSGMKGEEAAAVEAASSTGGQLMPPIMGAAAFLIAQFIGIPYAEVALAALIPALLFYVAMYFVIDATARKKGYRGVPRAEMNVTWRDVAARLYLLAPVVLLVYQIMAGRALSTATMQGIFATIALGFIAKTLEGLRRHGAVSPLIAAKAVLIDAVTALDVGARSAVAVAIPCAGAGIVVGIASMTNLGLTFGSFVTVLSGGMFFPALFLVMLMVIIMGMGMPTTAAYIMGAILAIPALDQFGVPPLAAHFFVLYFAALSMVTPPVALAAFVTAGIAKANVWKTGWLAFRYSLAGFLVAFALVLSPTLLMQGAWLNIALATTTALLGCYVLAACVAGYLRATTHPIENLLLFAAAFMLIMPLLKASLAGLVLFALVWLWQGKKMKTATGGAVGKAGS
jgi:TRAP transporter 4TM/12TM fusion protein